MENQVSMELKEALIHALENETAKKASQPLRSTQNMRTVTEPKQNNAVMDAMKDQFQKYSDRKQS